MERFLQTDATMADSTNDTPESAFVISVVQIDGEAVGESEDHPP